MNFSISSYQLLTDSAHWTVASVLVFLVRLDLFGAVQADGQMAAGQGDYVCFLWVAYSAIVFFCLCCRNVFSADYRLYDPCLTSDIYFLKEKASCQTSVRFRGEAEIVVVGLDVVWLILLLRGLVRNSYCTDYHRINRFRSIQFVLRAKQPGIRVVCLDFTYCYLTF